MSNVMQLPGAPTPETDPVPETVELIERMLEKAKSGEIRSVAVAYTLEGRGTITNWHNNGEFYVLMSSVAVLHHEMLHAGVIIEN